MNFITKLSGCLLFKTVTFKLIIIMIVTFTAPVFSQDSSQQLLRDGIKLYEEGKIDQAIAKLSSCVEKGDLTKELLTEAYKYLAQAYMAKDLRDQAKESVEKLLKIMPNYKPDPLNDRPQYIELVEKVREEQAVKPEPTEKPGIWTRYKKWFLIGGGAVVGVVMAVVLLSPAKDENLPTPPDFPR